MCKKFAEEALEIDGLMTVLGMEVVAKLACRCVVKVAVLENGDLVGFEVETVAYVVFVELVLDLLDLALE